MGKELDVGDKYLQAARYLGYNKEAFKYPNTLGHTMALAAQSICPLTDMLAIYARENNLQVEQKPDDLSIVTNLERANEKLVSGILTTLFNGYNFKGEEGTIITNPSNIRWFLYDPVDGGKLLLTGDSGWTSCLAVAYQLSAEETAYLLKQSGMIFKMPLAGFIYDPILKKLHFGVTNFYGKARRTAYSYNFNDGTRDKYDMQTVGSRKQRGNTEWEIRYIYDDSKGLGGKWRTLEIIEETLRKYSRRLSYLKYNERGESKLNMRNHTACNIRFADLAAGNIEGIMLIGRDDLTDIDNYASGIALVLAANGAVRIWKIPGAIFIMASANRHVLYELESNMKKLLSTVGIGLDAEESYSFTVTPTSSSLPY